MSIIIYSVLVLVLTGIISAVILYFVARKFKVVEDPRIDLVVEKLPGANCGGCGFAGCRSLADAIVKAESLETLRCPVGGDKVSKEIASLLGLEAVEADPQVAVVRCNGGKINTTSKVKYEGVQDCLYAHLNMSSEGGCPNGCLGLGNCVSVCAFDAIKIDSKRGLPIVDEEKCEKVCEFDAIKIENNLAYIDFNKCRLCRKCVIECPTGAIQEVNFPPRKEKSTVEQTETIQN